MGGATYCENFESAESVGVAGCEDVGGAPVALEGALDQRLVELVDLVEVNFHVPRLIALKLFTKLLNQLNNTCRVLAYSLRQIGQFFFWLCFSE